MPVCCVPFLRVGSWSSDALCNEDAVSFLEKLDVTQCFLFGFVSEESRHLLLCCSFSVS